MPNQADSLDDLFAALSDPTRRAVIKRLVHGPVSVSDLAAPFQMALPSFMQHIKVLEASGLLVSEKRGRTRMCRIEARKLNEAQKWLEEQRIVWEARLDRLDELVIKMEAAKD